MEQRVLDYTRRTPKGSGAARKLRREGRLPGVLYGHKQDTVPLTVDKDEFGALLHSGHRTMTLQDGPRSEMALVKAIQYDPLGSHIIHVDFTRVALDEKVQVTVPIDFAGQPKGVSEGGVLDQVAKDVNVECLATAIPESIRVNIQHLEIDQSLHFKELPAEDGITILDDPENVVAVIHPPRVVEEEAEEEAEEAVAEPEVIGREAEKDEEEPAAEEEGGAEQ